MNTPLLTDNQKAAENNWILWSVLGLFLLVFGPTMVWLWERWTMSVWNNGHGIVVTLLVAYLIREDFIKNSQITVTPSAWGFVILVPALVLHILDTGIKSQLLSAFALILSLPGLSLLFLGKERTRNIVFLLFSLLLTLPIPLTFTESIHLALRHIAANSVEFLLRLLHIPVYKSGTVLQIENGSLQVADACSGFATLYATVTVAILTAYLCKDFVRRILVLVIAVPLAISINIVRVLALVLLVKWFGIDILKTFLHELSGLLTFMVALPLILWLGHSKQALEK